ncbi:MAG: zinc ribbon domain-containing protein [Candidatus Neomarinimicrobiota bacterium]
MQSKNWSCIKCGHKTYEIGEMRVAGSFWQKIFNVQRTKFRSVSCARCTYTEFFKGVKGSKITDVFDFFTT